MHRDRLLFVSLVLALLHKEYTSLEKKTSFPSGQNLTPIRTTIADIEDGKTALRASPDAGAKGEALEKLRKSTAVPKLRER
jgi:hypothetical protein